jgi:pimeloyl-ACP methyl ester carboxylesterase
MGLPSDTQPAVRRERVVEFTAGDGFKLNLVNVRGEREPTREPVILVHGAGVRGNIFRAPVQTTIVDALVDAGYDVWLENWRASIEFAPNDWTLDQAALHDHPAAVRTVTEETHHDRVKAIIHCQGSTSFMMSAHAGLIPEVDTIVTNAVSLHTLVPSWSQLKIKYAVPLVNPFLHFLNPAWGDHPPSVVAKLLTLMVRAVHHECDNTVCKMVSFTYGAGFPALWRHENLDPETHERFIPREFGHVPLTFFRQMAQCVRRGNLVSYEGSAGLPQDYVAAEPQTDARFVFLAGEKNRCFLPESQVRSYEYFSARRPNYHSLHVVPGYSHLDMFLGRSAGKDIFPMILEELERTPASSRKDRGPVR